jgi:hypothetical protein
VVKLKRFSRKNDSKKVLEKHFKADINYKIVLRQAPQNLSGGRPSEKIMMKNILPTILESKITLEN